MTDDPSGVERFSDPRRMFEDARDEKAERRGDLLRALAGARVPEPELDDAELDALLDAIGERVATRLGREMEHEPVPFFTGAMAAKEARKAALVGALTGRPRLDPSTEPRASAGFDGGAGRTEANIPRRRPPTHDELLAEILLRARAHRSSGF